MVVSLERTGVFKVRGRGRERDYSDICKENIPVILRQLHINRCM
jgi:hypothetical protein